METNQATAQKWTATCGPRQLKKPADALARLRWLRNSHVELSGIIGGEERRTVLTTLCGTGSTNPDADARYLALGERFGWTITRENFREVEAAALEAVAAATAALPAGGAHG